nr:sulfite exporter TauE/SafE family protein [Rhodoplanes tepidamans]
MLPALGAGGIVGFVLGLVGGGGSVLATPLLLYLVGIESPHVAIGTGALAVSINAYANLALHARRGHVRWPHAVVFALVGTAGALLGSSLGLLVDGRRLLFLFGLAMAGVGVAMLRRRPATAGALRPVDLRSGLATAAAGAVTGLASGFFGIGGGFLAVPALLLATGMSTIGAVGSSLLAVGTFGLATALTYARAGQVDWMIAAELVAGGLVGGVLGMLLAVRLSGHKAALNRILAALVLTVAAYVLLHSLPGLDPTGTARP